MDMMLAGFVTLGVLIMGQIAWLRRDILELRWTDERSADLQWTLEGIRLLRAELGIESGELPRSRDEADRELDALRARVTPPSPEQKSYLHQLLEETNGECIGNLDSYAQAAVLIEQLRQERERRRIRREINARRRGSCATNGNGMSREEWLFLGVILILAVAGYLFPTFGMLSLVLGLAALFVALPIRWASGGSSGNLLMLFAMGALGLLYHRFGLLPVIVRRVVFNAVLLSFPLFLSTTSGNR